MAPCANELRPVLRRVAGREHPAVPEGIGPAIIHAVAITSFVACNTHQCVCSLRSLTSRVAISDSIADFLCSFSAEEGEFSTSSAILALTPICTDDDHGLPWRRNVS